jgi:glycosyltransferase involved in cell wall biosynthesis
MLRFAQQGNKVLYIEAQASMISMGVVRRDFTRIVRWLKSPRKVEDNLFVATLPLVLPFFQMSFLINRINNWFIKNLLQYWIKKLKLNNILLWTYNPYSESFIGKLGESFSVYECVDELSEAKGLVKKNVISTYERRLLEKVNIVIVTHENLYRSKKHLNKNIYLIPNAAEVEHFKKSSLSSTPLAPEMLDIPKPIIGFMGSIQYWIDLDLIGYIATARPGWSIVLIGPIGRLSKMDKINELNNIYLLGKKEYDTLPSYIKGFDVCINPYVRDNTANNCSPLKLYEYLASGKPVVSVDMPEANKFDGVLKIGISYEDFVEKIELSLNQLPDKEETINSRIGSVQQHSWNARFQQLEEILKSNVSTMEK